jgi:hypothetical protein
VAIRKGANSCKLVCKDVATGSRDVTKSSLAHQKKTEKFRSFLLFDCFAFAYHPVFNIGVAVYGAV